MARPRTVEAKQELTPGDWAVLALVTESPSHGWAIAAKLARGGEVGSIWSLGRPLVYQALARLEQEGLIRAVALERGDRGPHRVIYQVTARGRKAVREWLLRPIKHARDIRSLFLLKIILSQRQNIDLERLLSGQRQLLLSFVASIEMQIDDPALNAPGERTVLAFRLEAVQMIVRFIDDTLSRTGAPAKPGMVAAMPVVRKSTAIRKTSSSAARKANPVTGKKT